MRSSALVVFFAATAAFATTAQGEIGPPIAYVSQSSTRFDIYLVNPDGTGLSRLYGGAAKHTISAIDLKPGGGEIAFTDQYKLKILAYDERGVAVGSPRSIALPCNALGVDYHPTDGSLAVADECSPRHIWRLAAGASAVDPVPLATGTNIILRRWSRSGARLYYRGPGGLFAYDPATGSSTVVDAQPIGDMSDVTLTGDRAILQQSGGPAGPPEGSFTIQDFTTGAITNGCTLALMPHYGNSDTQMVYKQPGDRSNATYVMVHKTDCSGAPFRLTGRGTYWSIDWRAP
jgi:hypothetical protein